MKPRHFQHDVRNRKAWCRDLTCTKESCIFLFVFIGCRNEGEVASRLSSSCTQKRVTNSFSVFTLGGNTCSTSVWRNIQLTSLSNACTSLPSQPSPYACSPSLMGERVKGETFRNGRKSTLFALAAEPVSSFHKFLSNSCLSINTHFQIMKHWRHHTRH